MASMVTPRQASDGGDKDSAARGSAMRILIADDHPIVRHGLRQLLESEADMVVVGEARNGDEALKLVGKLDWDVAVLDYSMPGTSGLELIQEIKRQHPQRAVLVLSMFPEESHAARVYKAHAEGYITKELASEELAAAIRKVGSGGKYVSPAFAEKMVSELGSDSEKPLHETLSDREYRVMWSLASGKQINEIAAALVLSPSTISTYRTRILKKLKLEDNAALVRYAVKQGLI
jgi:two-component system, NarL family, invasion response regulator UvrY